MDKALENYLDTVDKHLKLIPTSERVDIVKEIKSYMVEMERKDGLSPQEIIDRLGSPKDMAQAYLGDLLSQNTGFHWGKLLMIIAFYSVAGFSGLIVIPTLAILAPALIFCGILTPVLGFVKLMGYVLNFDTPYLMFQIGPYTLHPLLAFVVSAAVGAGLCALGWGSWKLLKQYIYGVGKKKRDLSI